MASDLESIYRHLRQRQFPQAEALARAALTQNPFDGALTDILGVVARGRGDNAGAIQHFTNAVAFEPKSALFRCHLAMALKADRRDHEARAMFEEALALDPKSFESAYNYALFLQERGESDAAVEMAGRACALNERFAGAHNNLGVALRSAGRYEDAVSAFRHAIALDPDYATAYANLSTLLAEVDRPDEALKLAEYAIGRWPTDPQALNARVVALVHLNKHADAVTAADAVIAADPGYAQAHYGRAMALLAQGIFAEGFEGYEWRTKRPDFYPRRYYGSPRWTGGPLPGQTLLIHWEQGLGDTIQFCRYLPMLRAMFDEAPLHTGSRIVMDCPRSLIRLIETVGGIDEIGDYGTDPPAHDAHVPLMSLPWIFGTHPETIPSAVPYLAVPRDRNVMLAAQDGRLKVGLTWTSERASSYRRKVCRASDLEPLFAVSGVRFFSLQFGDGAAELEPYAKKHDIADLASSCADFADTAACVSKLDLVIAIDTAVVHVAGALAKPTWILLPFSADWRWGVRRADCPWYPTLRLFRQPRPGDWAEPIQAVAAALQDLAAP